MPSAKSLVSVLFFTMLTVAGAKISYTLPGIQVPFTMQTIGIIGAGLFLPPALACFSITTYVVSGLFFPVFAGTNYGPRFFEGASTGYVLFFPVAALAVSLLKQKFATRQGVFLLAVMAHLLIVIPGSLWGAIFGFYSFNDIPKNLMWLMPGTVIKSGILGLVVPQVKKMLC